METSKNPRSVYMIAVTSVMFLVSVCVTLVAAFLLVEQDRGFLFWLTVGFVVLVELVAFSFTLGHLTARLRKDRDQVSVPMLVASWVTLVTYTFVGAASIIIYALTRDINDPADKAFAAVLMVETAIAFLLVLLLRSWDLFFRAGQPPIQNIRQEHRASGLTLQPVLGRLETMARRDPTLAISFEKIAKRLNIVQSALLHSHGGGIGSREAGVANGIDPAVETEMRDRLAKLSEAVETFDGGDHDGQQIAQIESLAEQLQNSVAALDLD